MKTIMALLLALMLPVCAFAEEDVTANGVVESQNLTYLTAPCTGVLRPFTVENGDVAAQGDALFELVTLGVYAPMNGKVRAVFAQAGEMAADVMTEYGMLASIEREENQIIEASTSGAYNDPDNRYIHAGEVVYFEQTNDRDNVGEGRIISVAGKNYTVRLTGGDFEDGDDVKIYRDDKMASKSCIGSGEVAFAADVPVTGNGYVLRCAVEEGDAVKQGDLLFEVLGIDADSSLASPVLTAPASGAVELSAQSGMQVYKGQVLATIHDLSALKVVATVDEIDLGRLKVGDSLSIAFDRFPDEGVMGTVTQIASLGVARQNATYYDVTLEFFTMLEVLPGMNATITLPAAK